MRPSAARPFRNKWSFAVLAVAALNASFASRIAAHEPDAEEIALGSLVDAELAFARLALEQGIRAAFLANFANDGMIFEPAPARLHDTWPRRPAPADPKALRLEWHPAQAGVARSRTMGYTTGPFTLTDATRPESTRRGVFFSVWQRDNEGKWQVVIDAGVMTPQAVDFVPLGAAPRPGFAGRPEPKAEQRRLLARERRAFSADAKASGPSSYAGLLARDARLHRDGIVPIAGRDAVARHVSERLARIEWTPMAARVSPSADLAFTYGKYRETDRQSQVRQGYYAHLWLRDAGGRWRLAYDIAGPAA